MVVVSVRETYDLHTVQNKMTVIGIHTPHPDIIKRNFPGLLMQCRAYRPKSCNVALACASVLPLDPLGVGLSEGDVAPEDVFNPILYKAMSNKGMSQLEARINAMSVSDLDVNGNTANVDVDSFTTKADEFGVYYGLLSQANIWKHANPQAGLTMKDLRPLVYEMVYNVGDQKNSAFGNPNYSAPEADGYMDTHGQLCVLGKAKEMPFINCTSYSISETKYSGAHEVGFSNDSGKHYLPSNCECDVPWIRTFVGCIIVPPSRLHELFFRMTVVWDIEFSKIRPVSELANWDGLAYNGAATHYQNYSYESTKEVVTGDPSSILDGESTMVATNANLEKVM